LKRAIRFPWPWEINEVAELLLSESSLLELSRDEHPFDWFISWFAISDDPTVPVKSDVVPTDDGEIFLFRLVVIASITAHS
jgi:hypothetical protein